MDVPYRELRSLEQGRGLVLTTDKAVLSLVMDIELVDGTWVLSAPWLDEPLMGPTWEELYWIALEKRPR